MRDRVMKAGVAAALGVVSLGLSACTPPQALAVNTAALGHDANPGDKVCEVTPGAGDCTLEAAVDEANALGNADIAVPAGYYPGNHLTLTGTVSINKGAPGRVFLPGGSITVAAGAKATIDGVGFGSASWEFDEFTIDVAGTLTATGIQPFSWTTSALHVAPGGSATVIGSGIIGGTFQDFLGVAVTNEGSFTSHFSTIHQIYGGTAITNLGVGSTTLDSTLVLSEGEGCAGPGFSSNGYNSAPATCGVTAPTDQIQTSGLPAGTWTDGPYRYEPAASSPLLDAVPSGTLGCGTIVTVDINDRVRPIDGDGVAGASCDIGNTERLAPA